MYLLIHAEEFVDLLVFLIREYLIFCKFNFPAFSIWPSAPILIWLLWNLKQQRICLIGLHSVADGEYLFPLHQLSLRTQNVICQNQQNLPKDDIGFFSFECTVKSFVTIFSFKIVFFFFLRQKPASTQLRQTKEKLIQILITAVKLYLTIFVDKARNAMVCKLNVMYACYIWHWQCMYILIGNKCRQLHIMNITSWYELRNQKQWDLKILTIHTFCPLMASSQRRRLELLWQPFSRGLGLFVDAHEMVWVHRGQNIQKISTELIKTYNSHKSFHC